MVVRSKWGNNRATPSVKGKKHDKRPHTTKKCPSCGTDMIRLGERTGVQYWCTFCKKMYDREEKKHVG